MEQAIQEFHHYIQDSLDCYLVDNATFLAERLFALDPSDESRHILATCYFRLREIYRAFALLHGLYNNNNKTKKKKRKIKEK